MNFLLSGIALLALLSSFATAADTNPESAISTVLLLAEKSWDGATYTAYPSGQPEMTLLKIKIPPHTTLPWHTHPMPNVAYVVSGTLEVENADGSQHRTISAGEVLPEMVNGVHRGKTGDAAAELLVFYAGADGQSTAIPAAAPVPEPAP